MKFFTSEWWSGCQRGNNGGDAFAACRAHVDAIRERLTPELLALQERLSLHDANLIALRITPETRTGVIRLILADGRELELRYSGLSAFESVQTADNALEGRGGFGDLGYDEVDVLDDGSFEHRMLFSSSIEMRFRFSALKLQGPAAM